MRRAIVLAVLLTACERPVPDVAGVPPRGWIVSGGDFRAFTDRGTGGLEATRDGAGAGTLMQSIAADAYRGKRVRWSASVSTERVGRWAGLWMRVDRPHGHAGFDNMQNRPIGGTTTWTRREVVLDVPDDATAIRFGLVQDGPGVSRIDEGALEIVDARVAATSLDAHPRALVNPGFESGTSGWVASRFGDAGDVAPDRTERHGGASSVRIRASTNGAHRRTMLLQRIRAAELVGRRVRATAWVKGAELAAGGVLVQVLAAESGAGSEGISRGACGLEGTFAWQRCEIVFDVPRRGETIEVSPFVGDRGTLWVDDVGLEAVAADTPLTWVDERATTAAPGDFEGTGELPFGWFLSGGALGHYDAAIDRTAAHGGTASARLAPRRDPVAGYGTLMQLFRAERYRGRRLRVSAWIRGHGIEHRGDFWVRVQGEESPADGPGLAGGGEPLRGTFDWRRVEVVLDVPALGDAIQLGVGLHGRGTVWIDDVAVEDVGDTQQLTRGTVPAAIENGGLEQSLAGWFTSGGARDDFDVALDATERAAGATSARLQPRAAPRGYGTLMQSLDAAPFRGRRLRMTALVKGRAVAGRGDLWLRVQAPYSPADGPGLGGGVCRLTGSFDWRRCEIVFDVPAAAEAIQLGIGLDARGTLWLDEVTLGAVSLDTPVTAPVRAPTAPVNLGFD